MAKNVDNNIWNSFSYLTTNQKRSIVDLAMAFEAPIKINAMEKNENISSESDSIFYEYNEFPDIMTKITDNFELSLENQFKGRIDSLEQQLKICKNFYCSFDDVIKSIDLCVNRNHAIKKSAENIQNINSETFLIMNNLRTNYDLVNWFLSELQDIEKIKSLNKLNIDDFDSISTILDSIDRSWKLMTKCGTTFPQYSYYTALINNARLVILNGYENVLEKIVVNAASNVLKNLKTGEDTSYNDFINNFKSYSSSFKKYILIIFPRKDSHPDYSRFFNIVFTKYVEIRQKIVTSLILNSFTSVTNKTESQNPLELTKIMCKLLMNICSSEYNLIFDYFNYFPEKITMFINSLTVLIYDNLLPYLVKVGDIDTLCDLIFLFSNDLIFIEEEDKEKSWVEEYKCTINQMRLDVTGRLVFKVEEFVKKRILNSDVSALPFDQFDTPSNIIPQDNTINSYQKVIKHKIFEPIKISCKLLNQLYVCLPKSLFEKIAKDCITSCIKNVEDTYNTSSFKDKLKGYLFVIRYLLYMREEMTSYDVEFITKEIVLEFGDIKKATLNIIKNRSNLLSLSSNNALIQFFLEGAPRLTEKWIDSKKEIEIKIRSYCFDLIKLVTHQLTNIPEMLYDKLKDCTSEEILKNEQLKPEEIKHNINEFYSRLLSKYVEIKKTFSAYLENTETESILLKPIKINLMNCYKNLYTQIQILYSEEARMIIGLPLIEQVSLIMN